jgi:hypothetical protein
MPQRTVGRLIAIALAAGALLVAAGAGAPDVLASPASPAHPAHPASLHVTYRIALGNLGDTDAETPVEAPDGAVFYARGTVVYVVDGHKAPVVAEHAGAAVLALAASDADLFVETGHVITEYSRSTGNPVRHWTVSPGHTPTSATLLVEGGVLWADTDWATDESGFEYATVYRILLGSPTVHVVSDTAYPGDIAADATALFYESQGTTHAFVERVSPSGATRSSAAQSGLDAPLTVSGSRVVVLALHGTADKEYADSYRTSTVARISSKLVDQDIRVLAGTKAGLLVLEEPCVQSGCAGARVATLNAATGVATGALVVAHAYGLLQGADPAALTVSGSAYTLVRLS